MSLTVKITASEKLLRQELSVRLLEQERMEQTMALLMYLNFLPLVKLMLMLQEMFTLSMQEITEFAE